MILAPAIRAELCRRLAASGMPLVEAVSFVSRHVPAMAGAEEVVAALPELRDERLLGLVLNRRGYERAVATGLRRVDLTIPVTDTFARRNQGSSRPEAERLVADVVSRAHEEAIEVVVTVSVSFGCPFEGRVSPARTLELVERVAAHEADAIVLADTIGVAVPAVVSRTIAAATECGIPIGGHFHDTRNTGIANCLAALEAGAVRLDASVGGVGGCPFAPGASGNVATEDLVYVLEESGLDTGIDLDGLIDCARWLADRLAHPIPSSLARAGRFPAASLAA